MAKQLKTLTLPTGPNGTDVVYQIESERISDLYDEAYIDSYNPTIDMPIQVINTNNNTSQESIAYTYVTHIPIEYYDSYNKNLFGGEIWAHFLQRNNPFVTHDKNNNTVNYNIFSLFENKTVYNGKTLNYHIQDSRYQNEFQQGEYYLFVINTNGHSNNLHSEDRKLHSVNGTEITLTDELKTNKTLYNFYINYRDSAKNPYIRFIQIKDNFYGCLVQCPSEHLCLAIQAEGGTGTQKVYYNNCGIFNVKDLGIDMKGIDKKTYSIINIKEQLINKLFENDNLKEEYKNHCLTNINFFNSPISTSYTYNWLDSCVSYNNLIEYYDVNNIAIKNTEKIPVKFFSDGPLQIKFNHGKSADVNYVGEIKNAYRNYLADNWAICNGESFTDTEYPILFKYLNSYSTFLTEANYEIKKIYYDDYNKLLWLVFTSGTTLYIHRFSIYSKTILNNNSMPSPVITLSSCKKLLEIQFYQKAATQLIVKFTYIDVNNEIKYIERTITKNNESFVGNSSYTTHSISFSGISSSSDLSNLKLYRYSKDDYTYEYFILYDNANSKIYYNIYDTYDKKTSEQGSHTLTRIKFNSNVAFSMSSINSNFRADIKNKNYAYFTPLSVTRTTDNSGNKSIWEMECLFFSTGGSTKTETIKLRRTGTSTLQSTDPTWYIINLTNRNLFMSTIRHPTDENVYRLYRINFDYNNTSNSIGPYDANINLASGLSVNNSNDIQSTTNFSNCKDIIALNAKMYIFLNNNIYQSDNFFKWSNMGSSFDDATFTKINYDTWVDKEQVPFAYNPVTANTFATDKYHNIYLTSSFKNNNNNKMYSFIINQNVKRIPKIVHDDPYQYAFIKIY